MVLLLSPQVAVPKLSEAAMGADLLVFVVPHQFIRKLCDEMVGCVSARARGITLIKVIIHRLTVSYSTAAFNFPNSAEQTQDLSPAYKLS